MLQKIPLPQLHSVYIYRGEDCLVAHVDEQKIRLEGFRFNAQYRFSPDKFHGDLASGELRLKEEACFDSRVAAILNMTERQKARFRRRCEYARAFFREFGPNLPRRGFERVRQEVSARIADSKPPGYTTALTWCKTYWASGRSEVSLVEKIGYQRKRTKRLTPEVEKILETAINDIYLKEERISDLLAYRIFCGRLVEASSLFGNPDHYKRPSFNTVRSRLHQLDPFRKIELREGRWVAKKKNRRGEPLQYEERIGARVEVDSNRVDILVRNEEFNVTYRPELTIMLDVATRCVIGWDLSMKVASAAKTLSALKDAIVSDDFYPTRVVPEQLVLDNGKEFVNNSLEGLCDAFRIEIRRAAPRSPDQKAFVERVFGTFNTGFFHTLPGTKKSNPAALGDYDAEEASVYTIEDLQRLFRQYLSEVYHRQVHSALGVSPAERWEELSRELPPRTLPREQVEQSGLIRVACSVNHGQVRAFGLSWYGAGLPTAKEVSLRQRTPPKAILMINPDRIGEAWVASTDPKIPPQRVLSRLPTRYHGKSLAEMEMILEDQKASIGRKNSDDLGSLDAAVSRLSREAALIAKSRKNKTKAKELIRAEGKYSDATNPSNHFNNAPKKPPLTKSAKELTSQELPAVITSPLEDQKDTKDLYLNIDQSFDEMPTLEIKRREGK